MSLTICHVVHVACRFAVPSLVPSLETVNYDPFGILDFGIERDPNLTACSLFSVILSGLLLLRLAASLS
jgi:hypothetical protein